jgi:hypothetical protein
MTVERPRQARSVVLGRVMRMGMVGRAASRMPEREA